MTDRGGQWSLSNPGPQTLSVWLEPWADEVVVPIRSTITLTVATCTQDCSIGEVEMTPDHLVVWANAAGMIEARVDGVLQHTGSAIIPVPDGLTKGMLGVVFGGQASARLAGRPSDSPNHTSWWQRIRHRFGF